MDRGERQGHRNVAGVCIPRCQFVPADHPSPAIEWAIVWSLAMLLDFRGIETCQPGLVLGLAFRLENQGMPTDDPNKVARHDMPNACS